MVRPWSMAELPHDGGELPVGVIACSSSDEDYSPVGRGSSGEQQQEGLSLGRKRSFLRVSPPKRLIARKR
jgi:hypothetical protein